MPESRERAPLAVVAQIMPSFNYALHFNHKSLIQEIRIINRLNEPINGIHIKVSSDIPFFDAFDSILPEIPQRFNDSIGDIPLRINTKYLAGLTESVNAVVKIALANNEEEICSFSQDVPVLPFDQSALASTYPEYLASFITPNHPAIPGILHDASDILNSWGKERALEGYQAEDPNRIRDFAAAIFAAIQKKAIVYSNPPATTSREWTDGQRIRTVDAVLDQRLATCMDFTLFYASCLEAMHLNPILCLVAGHIFAGVWLDENGRFDAPVVDDAKVLKAKMDNGHDELILVECTDMQSGADRNFEDAIHHSQDGVLSARNFVYAIDVHRVREIGIRPLPSRVLTSEGYKIDYQDLDDSHITKAPDFHNLTALSGDNTKKRAITKQDVWEGKLLDLSLRNILLNLPHNASVMPLMASKIDEIEDALASGEEFKFTTVPEQDMVVPLNEEGAVQTNVFSILDTPVPFCYNEHVIDPPPALIDYWFKQYSAFVGAVQRAAKKSGNKIEIVEDAIKGGFAANLKHWLPQVRDILSRDHAKRRLHSFYIDQEELDKALDGFFRAARSAKQENGISSLYLSLGLLKWYEKEDKECEHPLFAPLLLVPVEIVRKSAGQGYSFYRRDEDTVLNPALLEMLRQNFQIEIAGVDPLPTDDSGVDAKLIFSRIKAAILGMDNWECFETALLGNFSFAQFAMWNDIHSNPDALEKSDVVRSLMKGHVDWDNKQTEDTDDQVFLPINVDATQLEAIRMAAKGETFVLHGPPGTGKSQTITAMIANAVAHGKSVLFVAEKMAALSVVDRRLTGLGIGDFCLELHSDKANKKHVLSQIERALSATDKHSGGSYAALAEELALKQEKLDSYAQHLYAERPCGFSLRELVDMYDAFDHAAPSVAFTPDEANKITVNALRDMPEMLRSLMAAGNAVGTIVGNPLLGTGLTAYTSEVRSNVSILASDYRSACSVAEKSGASFAACVGAALPMNHSASESLYHNAEIFLTNSRLSVNAAELLTSGNADAEAYLTEAGKVDTARKKMLEKVDFDLLGMDMETLLKEHQAAAKKLFGKGKAIAAFEEKLKPHLYQSVTFDRLPALLNEIKEFQQQEKRLGDKLRQVPERFRDALKCFPDLAAYRKAAEAVASAKRFPGGRAAIERLTASTAAADAAEQYVDAWQKLQDIAGKLNELLMRKGSDDADDFFAQEISLCDKLINDPSSLKEWTLYQNKRLQCVQNGLLPAVRAYENGMACDTLVDATKKGLYFTLINDIVGSDDILNTFSGATFNESVQQFRRLDEALLAAAKEEIFNRLVANLPTGRESADAGKELNILRKAIQSGGRGLSIRALFEMIPNILTKLCPCMLMSPNSVAQYLSHALPLFDVVIFDEASQLPTCKAVGALSRAKSAVVVGDPKQMPPTSFFSGSGPEVDDLALDDLDSVLDDCLALGITSRYLQWHYRSTHESLIAFSNSQFYENKMFTFPSANDRERHVSVAYVDGVFERSKGRCNHKEAEAIVQEVIRRYKDKTLRKYSVGIVTFNANQQKEIEDVLNEAFRRDPKLDAWANTGDDPLFVKNLENVQGDERDVILFSIGYGPDSEGHVSMNFGPINQEGGWKRLNVAFSRARVAMVIFSSLHPEQIDLRRTSSEGVAALRNFLLFAEGRQGAAFTQKAEGNDNSGIIANIRSFLEQNGYQVETMIGQSDFHVDMAVVDPFEPTRYLLGILLDGDTYRQTEYTRDREVAQENVLKNLGWSLHRIWTIDWWDGRAKEQEKLLNKLTVLRSAAEERAAEMQRNAAIPAEDTVISTDTVEETTKPASEQDADINIKPQQKAPTVTVNVYGDPDEPVETPAFNATEQHAAMAAVVTKQPEDVVQQSTLSEQSHSASTGFVKLPYQTAELEQLSMSGDEFCAKESADELRKRVLAIAAVEAPIEKELLIKRLIRSCGISRSNAAIIETAEKAIRQSKIKANKQGDSLYYWLPEQNQSEWQIVRDCGDRAYDSICKQELRNAICYALQEMGTMQREQLIKEASRTIGYTRLTQQIRDVLEAALVFAKNTGNLTIARDGTVTPASKE